MDEGPSAEDLEKFGDETRTCPECGTDVYDQSDVCHSCGYAFSAGGKSPTWVIVAAVLVLLAFGLVFAL